MGIGLEHALNAQTLGLEQDKKKEIGCATGYLNAGSVSSLNGFLIRWVRQLRTLGPLCRFISLNEYHFVERIGTETSQT